MTSTSSSPKKGQAASNGRNSTERSSARVPLTHYHVILFLHGVSLNRQLAHRVQLMLDEKVTTPREQTLIDVWLESPGGDANAAYKLFLELRARAAFLRAVIPDYAKSAATLLALGMDTIFMAPSAELGPLDVQVTHPDREDRTVSGLDISDALGFLARTAMDGMLSGGASLIQITELPRQQVLHEMSHFMAKFLQPSVSKIGVFRGFDESSRGFRASR